MIQNNDILIEYIFVINLFWDINAYTIYYKLSQSWTSLTGTFFIIVFFSVRMEYMTTTMLQHIKWSMIKWIIWKSSIKSLGLWVYLIIRSQEINRHACNKTKSIGKRKPSYRSWAHISTWMEKETSPREGKRARLTWCDRRATPPKF